METLYEQSPPVVVTGNTQASQQTKPLRPATKTHIDIQDLEIALSTSSGYIVNVKSQALRSVLADLKQYIQHHESHSGDAPRDSTNRQILLEIQSDVRELKKTAKQPE